MLACSKAFNLSKFDLLFTRLLDRSLPAVVVCVLAFSYLSQMARVSLGRTNASDTFSIRNSTRQGSMVNPA